MNLIKYSRGEQMSLVIRWSLYYRQGARTLVDIAAFDALFPDHLDDLLILMVLDLFTDFPVEMGLSPKQSICNIIFFILSDEAIKVDIDDFFALARRIFDNYDFISLGSTKEEIIEKTLDLYIEYWNKEDEFEATF